MFSNPKFVNVSYKKISKPLHFVSIGKKNFFTLLQHNKASTNQHYWDTTAPMTLSPPMVSTLFGMVQAWVAHFVTPLKRR